ncbi:hypothetical protein PEL8287_00007 [Roseovarius litorisediminis]|uniref:Surface antigen domain-containing protein n=1 Tax=Roseovarius litorisediminis TaxID=1312363 RepID=A0A1Y5R9P6_9RHOB|nr:hypothetical protein [Roseovarius litorisediminis]SLN09514.1 hypothetical protein PEL8287_00007 [Roseovarius litorisediminis]
MAALTRLLVLIAVIGWSGITPQTVQAQGLARMLDESGIEPESLAIMQDTAKSLYTANGKAIGDNKKWTNEKTGTAGRVEIVDLKNNCVQLFHRVEAGRSGKVTELRTWRCRTANGDWQMSAKP